MPSATPLTSPILHMILIFFMRCTKTLLTRSCLRHLIGSRRGGLGSGEKPPVGVGRVGRPFIGFSCYSMVEALVSNSSLMDYNT